MEEKAKVFISYAREDWETAKRLYDDLSRAGVRPWLDSEELLPGQNWISAIDRAIRESSAILILAVTATGSTIKKSIFKRI